MLAGDVPFKGSSIPAIMKKHISDPPPSFASRGVHVSHELEQAVFHTLEKDPDKRTASVEMLVEELRTAIMPSPAAIHSTMGQSLPVSSLKIVTLPPASKIYIDNIAVGETTLSGEMMLEGIQSGNHHLRVSKDGFQDWLGDVVCDGKPREIVAELRTKNAEDVNAIPMPGINTGGFQMSDPNASTRPFINTNAPYQPVVDKTMVQAITTGQPEIAVSTMPPKKSFFSPLVLGIVGILGLFVIGVVGLGAAFMLGAFGTKPPPGNVANSISPTPTPKSSASPVTSAKAELVSIPGGTFKMGRNEGRDNERPENVVEVKPFWMDKTEVTNGEYYAFVSATGYKPIPADWVNDKPIAGQELWPVRFVNIEDTKAFAEWRSKRDGKTYRLPTEAEWEYAARNGSKDNLYPWGDAFDPKCAVTDQPNTEPKPVGSASCPNNWGVVDLIGNVYEWTSSKVSLYPGSKGAITETKEQRNMIRGGAALNKSSGEFGITATFRADVDVSKRDKELGFRLVRME
jgi:formylglycine-generating enzyme required for sulfatase activity